MNSGHLISDIRVVPNRLEQELWLPLHSKKRMGKEPRIGWAGGTTHQGDLILLKETIEQTRDEADWVFFGMCPDEIRSLVAEYHALGRLCRVPGTARGIKSRHCRSPPGASDLTKAKAICGCWNTGFSAYPLYVPT